MAEGVEKELGDELEQELFINPHSTYSGMHATKSTYTGGVSIV